MGFANDEENWNVVGNGRDGQDVRVGGTRLARELPRVRYGQVRSLQLFEIAREYGLSEDSVWSILAELQTLGIVTLTSNSLASLNSPNPQEMQEAYEIRAALEEIAGRSAARALKRNTESFLPIAWELSSQGISGRGHRTNASYFETSTVHDDSLKRNDSVQDCSHSIENSRRSL